MGINVHIVQLHFVFLENVLLSNRNRLKPDILSECETVHQ